MDTTEHDERDVTDLGLSREVTVTELRELREQTLRRREAYVPSPRSETTELFGWKPRGAAFARPCPRCEAPSMTWCRAGRRVIWGKLCEAREVATERTNDNH